LETLHLRAIVISPDGQRIVRHEHTGSMAFAEALGTAVAEELLARGAGEILQSVKG
jgi:hydroxymethylbilane synthase